MPQPRSWYPRDPSWPLSVGPDYHWVDGSRRQFRLHVRRRRGRYCNSAGSSAMWANSAVAPAAVSFAAGVIAVKPYTSIPAATAARTPSGLSSTTAHRSGATPMRSPHGERDPAPASPAPHPAS